MMITAVEADLLLQAVQRAQSGDLDPYNALLGALQSMRYEVPTPNQSSISHVDVTDVELVAMALRDIFPDNIWDDSAETTARRIVQAWQEYNPPIDIDFDFTTFPADKGQMIIAGDIEFSSLCAHHLLPFTGKAHVGYIPNKLQVGLSKIPRLVDFWARRPQVQERLGAQIGNDLKRRLEPMGVMVVLEARHSCMACRGVRKHSGKMTTSLPIGIFLTNPHAKDEFIALIGRGDSI